MLFRQLKSILSEYCCRVGLCSHKEIHRLTSRASMLMKLAIEKPSMMSSSQDTDTRFLRRGGLCLGLVRDSLPPGPCTDPDPQSSLSEPEEGDVARCTARSTLLLRRSLSRWERERRLCLNTLLRIGPSMSKKSTSPSLTEGTWKIRHGGTFLSPKRNTNTGPQRSPCLKWR